MLSVAMAARIRRARIVLHHHSFAYLTVDSTGHLLLFAIASPQAIHIALCGEMERQLRARYASVSQVRVWSNSHPLGLTIASRPPLPKPDRPMAIGHMANLSIEKGLGSVLETLRRGLAEGLDLTLHLAGEPSDRQSEVLLNGAMLELDGRVVLWGFVSGGEKHRFLDALDVFLFPSAYRNEAEPVVVLEALAHGVPCFVTAVGCLGSMPGVRVIEDTPSFASTVVECLVGNSHIESFRGDRDEDARGSATDFIESLLGSGP
jgi:glycosyltransferase involved in cell wall biosynthesis